jgi:hypothetical protein
MQLCTEALIVTVAEIAPPAGANLPDPGLGKTHPLPQAHFVFME